MSKIFKYFTTIFAVILIYVMPVGGLGTGAYLPEERKFRIEIFKNEEDSNCDEDCNNEEDFIDSENIDENIDDFTLIDSILLNLIYNIKLIKDYEEDFVID